MGVLLVVAAIIGVLATSALGATIRVNAERLICEIAGQEDCGDSAGADSTAEQALQREIDELDPWASEHGGRYEELLDAARAALARGDLAEADRILELLKLYRQLGGGVRGDIVDALLSPDDAAFEDLLAEGTTYQDGGKHNRRFFQVDPAPGEGVLVYDFYIPFDSSLFLDGDDRDVADPLLGEYGMDRSRIMIVLDRETGRGVVVQTETCTTPIRACNEPRPITFDMDDVWANDAENDITGEGINIDMTNQFEIEADADSVRITYDALNSITPLGISIDGTLVIHRQEDGTYEKGEDTRDDYPAKATYHYRPGQEPDEIHDYGDIHPDQVDGALPLDPDIRPCNPVGPIRIPLPCIHFE